MDIKEGYIKLSEYNSSILNDEENALILTWIERSGITTEEELLNDIHLDEARLKNIILKLYQNQLIELSKNFFTVTFKGKRIISALKLYEEIIKNVFEGFEIEKTELYFLNDCLLNYRERYYEKYLRTLGSIKTWKRISSTHKYSYVDKHSIENSIGTILIHDLNKAFHQEAGWSNYYDLNLFIKNNLNLEQIEGKFVRHVKETLNQLYTSKELKTDNEYKDEFFQFLAYKDLMFTDEGGKTYWIEFKNAKEKNINEKTLSTFKTWKNKCFRIDSDFTTKFFINDPIKNKHGEIKDLTSLAFLLDYSNSIEEFSQKINLSKSETEDILNRIKQRIEKIFSEDPKEKKLT